MYYKIISTGKHNELLWENQAINDIKAFMQAVSVTYGLDFKLVFKKNSKYVKVVLLDAHPRETDNWRAEFQFRTCGKNNGGIFLKFIRFPVRLQGKGLGTYCVNWLEDLANKYGFKYIVFSAYNSADGFWRKLGYQYSNNEEFIQELYFSN
ncbi:GNAT family N-acetyltransferase [Desulfofalx alkaliphila]|uniref:GNAT family N-acetyltransferase n=1 Tax=Desulfofalx alkaliphila TaxID=105483 RepID=UPI0004E25555|nr:GNAT family N-acetyltransferase [Desulfofalx alkaliphila]